MLTNSLGHLHGWLAPMLLAQSSSAGFNVWATFMRAELFGKGIVILLVIFSLMAWTVMIGKYLDLSRWRELNLAFEAQLREHEVLMNQTVPASLRAGTPYARLCHAAIEAGKLHAADRESSVRMGFIENALQRGVAEECVRYEAKMVLLGSLVSGAPFMGLLGTVVGIMIAFNGMGGEGGASLQNLAPGVASALLATVCGLLVAIPSVFGYNFLLSQTKLLITQLENYASWLADRLELEMEKQKIDYQPSPVPAPYAAPTTPAPVATPVARPANSAVRPVPINPPAAAPESKPSPTERYLRLDVSEEE